MVHTYSLIHDDLPAMDDDDLRRGRPTCHKAFDEATAILAGDGLLTLAFEVLACEVRPPSAALRCVQVLAEAAGPRGMVAGQMADLQAEGRTEAEGRPADGTLAELEAIHRRKTGALLRAPLRMGAAIAEAPDRCIEALDRYGKAVGLAFQIVDDLLDVQGTAAAAAPGNWPRRPSRRWSPSARAATGSVAWRWHFWKGIVDAASGLGARSDPLAGRSEGTIGCRARPARGRDALRADRRRGPTIGPLRQQSRRRRAVPGAAPDL
jgi:hypothetical protein